MTRKQFMKYLYEIDFEVYESLVNSITTGGRGTLVIYGGMMFIIKSIRLVQVDEECDLLDYCEYTLEFPNGKRIKVSDYDFVRTEVSFA